MKVLLKGLLLNLIMEKCRQGKKAKYFASEENFSQRSIPPKR